MNSVKLKYFVIMVVHKVGNPYNKSHLETSRISCTSAQIIASTIPPSFRSESIHLPPTAHSNVGSRNDILDSHTQQASVAFGDEPDLTSHRWSSSLHSGTPAQSIAGKPCLFFYRYNLYNRQLFNVSKINPDGNC